MSRPAPIQMKPTVRPNGCVATTTHHTVKVPRPPITASTGTDIFPMRMLMGVRNGRGKSGSLWRSQTTETCATVNEIMAPNAYRSASRLMVLPGSSRSTQATPPKTMMAMYGVMRRGWTRPSCGGTCRCCPRE